MKPSESHRMEKQGHLCAYTHGSDYKGTERVNRYKEYFKDKGVEIVNFLYTQGTSSTQIRNAIVSKTKG